jgi:murein DD-endopeptidase MepM/ murein hydrolase activator NlpD
MDKADKKASNLRLTLLDATSHERLWSLRFSRTHFIIASISLVVVVFLAIFCLIAFTPIRTFIPGYPNARSRRQAVQNAQRIDSLQTRILQWELYTENLRRVVAGEDPIRLDTLMLGREGSRAVSDARYLAIRDSLLRQDVTEEEQFGVSAGSRRSNLPIEALSFYTPVKGVVSKGYERVQHPWVDVTAPVGSTVMAVLDGTVVYTSWEQESGYTLILQHGSDLLSVYKNNQKVLHRSGDVVKAGTPVGMLAPSSSLTKGDHLHFELWYKGASVDPSLYIKF